MWRMWNDKEYGVKTDADEPMYPCNNPKSKYEENDFRGLTKREYFAAMAIQGSLANGDLYKLIVDEYEPSEIIAGYASDAIRLADALIEELNRED